MEAKGHADRRPTANDSGLLFSREERATAEMKEEIDGAVRVSIRLNVMSSAEGPSIPLTVLTLCLCGAFTFNDGQDVDCERSFQIITYAGQTVFGGVAAGPSGRSGRFHAA